MNLKLRYSFLKGIFFLSISNTKISRRQSQRNYLRDSAGHFLMHILERALKHLPGHFSLILQTTVSRVSKSTSLFKILLCNISRSSLMYSSLVF